MIDNNIINESVTIAPPSEIDIDGILRELAREQPVTAPAELAEWRSISTMPVAYRRHLERLAAKRERARKRRGKPARGRRRGRYHWKNKEKTRKRRAEKEWREEPFNCLIGMNTYKCKRLDRAVWDEFYAPLWEQYKPTEIKIKWPRGTGTRASPWTLFNCKVYVKEKLVLDGTSLELYVLSGG